MKMTKQIKDYQETIEQTEKYLDLIPDHLTDDNENDLVSLLRRNFTLLKHYREGLEKMASYESIGWAPAGEWKANDELSVRTELARKTLEES